MFSSFHTLQLDPNNNSVRYAEKRFCQETLTKHSFFLVKKI
jgi:hypothetical protein